MTLAPSQLRAFAERYTAAWCSQDPASIAAYFAPNGSLSVNGVPAAGRDAIAEVAHGFMTAFPDMLLTALDITTANGHVFYRWMLDGTNTGPGGTGKRVRIIGFEKWTFGADSLIAESQGHFDQAEYQRQLKYGFDEKQR